MLYKTSCRGLRQRHEAVSLPIPLVWHVEKRCKVKVGKQTWPIGRLIQADQGVHCRRIKGD